MVSTWAAAFLAALAFAICSLSAADDFRFVKARASCFEPAGFLLGVGAGIVPSQDATSAGWSLPDAVLCIAGTDGFLESPLADALGLSDLPVAVLGVWRSGVFAARLSGLGLRPSGRKDGSFDAGVNDLGGGMRDWGVLARRDSTDFSGVPSIVDRADLKVAVDGSYSPLEADRLDDLDCGLPEPSEL